MTTDTEAPPVFRTANGVLTPQGDPYWGVTLHEVPNPDGNDIPEGVTDAIRLPADYAPLPGDQWGAMLDLFDYVLQWDERGQAARPDTTCEAAVVHLRGDGRLRPISEWETLAPTQAVGGGFAQMNYEEPLVNILTGERFDNLSQAVGRGFVHAGDTHSHGRFAAFHSGTDDRSDLRQPGIHMVVGNIHREGTAVGYETALSITREGKRYSAMIDGENVMRGFTMDDLIGPDRATRAFHEDVLTVVTRGYRTWVDCRDTKPVQRGPANESQGTLWAPLLVWCATQAQPRVVEEVEYDRLDSGLTYYLTKSNALAGVNPWIVGEDANAAHLSRPTGAYEGVLWDDDDDLTANLDALEAAYPGLAPLMGTLVEACYPPEVRDILRSLNDATVLDALCEAARGGGLDL